MRAVAEDREVAAIMGVNVRRVISLTFLLGSALGGAAGVLVGLYYTQIDFFMGYSAGLKAFTAAVLGGIGNIRGAMLGGLVLGLIESLAVTFINPAYRDVVAFVVLILVLVFRPTGLLGETVPTGEQGLMTTPARLADGASAWGLGAVALVAPLVAPNDYWIGVMARICLYATLALGLNVVVGFAGLLDIGYVAFFGIGSYLYAFLASPHFGLHLPFLLALPIVVVGHRAVRHPDRRADAAPARRLPRHRHAGVRRDHLSAPAQPRPARSTSPTGRAASSTSIRRRWPASSLERQHRSTTTCSWRCSRSRCSPRRACSTPASAGPGRRSARTSWPPARWASTRRWRSCRPSPSAPPSPASPARLLASWQKSVFPENFLFTESINMLPWSSSAAWATCSAWCSARR